MKLFMGKLLWCLTFKALKQSQCTKLVHIHRKNFRGTLENREKRESLAQQIFPRLWYIHRCSYYGENSQVM